MRLGLTVAVALLGLGALVACLGESEEPTPWTPGGEIPDVRLHKVEFTEVKDGAKQWHLKAVQVDYVRSSGLGRLSQVEVTFYPGKGEPVLVRSERGTFDSRAKEIELTGNVRGSAPPYHFYSDSLRYFPKDRVLETEDAARLESAGERVAGIGLRYGLEERQFHIRHDVKATSEQRLF
jgi:LPS export ABC transporter protein LptC